MSQVEACLWSVIAGRLEPALSLSSRTEDRLWCYLNAAVESRLDAAITTVHNGDFDVGIGREVENGDLRINSIFDEIATVCSLLTTSQKYLLRYLSIFKSKEIILFIAI